MPSLAIPAAVAASISTAAIAQSGQSTGSPASEPNGVAPADAATGGDGFAALLGRQMASATLPTDGAAVALSTTADQAEAAATDSAAPPVDLSALLQALLLPMSARLTSPKACEPNCASSDGQAASQPQGLLPGSEAGHGALQAMQESVAESPALRNDAAEFFDQMSDDTTKAAASAAIAGRTAESATREVSLQAAQPELQPAAPMISHTQVEAGRVERERLVVSTPVSSPSWHEDLGNKMTMLIGKEATSAELVLTPPHLGRVEVQLAVSGDQTSATFVAATPAAREALEQALPKLREFLADAGINLTQASVGGDAQAGQSNGDGTRWSRSGRGGTSGAVTEVALPAAAMRMIDGMVDTFA